MFLASKLLSFASQPLAWVMAFLFAGLLLLPTRKKWGARLLWAALALLLLQGWEPLPDVLIRRLEAVYPEPALDAKLQGYAGIVVLGGALDPAYVWQGHHQAALNDAAERMTVPVGLLRHYPNLRILFTGGEGELFANGLSEADRAKIFFDEMGLAAQQLIFETTSRNTYENAVFSARLAGVNPAQPWLLLTSAWHMPRAMAAFRKAGWNVAPYPVDFRTGTDTPWTQYSIAVGAQKWHLALHEMVGLLLYRLSGRA